MRQGIGVGAHPSPRPQGMGGKPQPHLNLAPPKPRPQKLGPATTIQYHVQHYAENPGRHARALKQLGLSPKQIGQVAQEARGTNPRVAGGRAPVRQASGFANIHNFTGSKFADKVLGEAAQTALYAIPGAAVAARHPVRAAKATYHGIGEDIHHPLRHPFYTGLDIFGAASLGAGGVARAAAVPARIAEGERGLGLLRGVEPGSATVKVGQAVREPPVPKGHIRMYRGEGNPGPVTENTGRNFTPQKEYARLYGHKGSIKYVDVTRAEWSRQHPGLQVPYHDRKLGLTTTASEYVLPPEVVARAQRLPEEMAAAEIRKPLSRNALYRQGQKVYYRGKQAELNAGQASRRTANLVGKEFRNQRRLGKDVSMGDVEHVRRATKGLSRGEKTAMRVVAIEGNKALGKQAAATVERHINFHHDLIGGGADKAAHQAVIRDLRSAQSALERPSAKLRSAIEATRNLANHGERESIARGLLEPATAQLRKQAIAEVYGGKAGPGSFYFHAGIPQKQSRVGRIFNPRPSEFGMGKPQTSRYAPELRRAFTGGNIKRGLVPVDIPHAVTQAYGRRLALHSAHDFYGTLRKASTETRESIHQIPIRVTTKISDDLRRYFGNLEENVHASPDEMAHMGATDLERLKQELEASEHAGAHLGAKIKGVRWVDERFIKDLGETKLRGPLEKAADVVNNPIRFSTLYLRPAYLLNALGNAGMLALEGHHAPLAMWKAARAEKLYGARNVAHMDVNMGEGRAIGQQVGTGPLQQGVHAVAQLWNMVTDLHARRAAFLDQAHRMGFKTPEQVDSLLHSPANRAKLEEAMKRARSVLGDYANLTPAERNTIRRLIYFYPWLKVATKWTGHTLTQHPVKSALLAQQGRVEAAHVKRILGLMPQWARLTGLVPTGGKNKAGLVNVVNPSSVNTPSTVVQTGASAANAARGVIGLKQKGTAGLQDVATPFLQAILTGGQPSTGGTQRSGLIGAAQGTPEYALLKRLGVTGKPSKTYPQKGVKAAVGPFVAGGLYPREISTAQLHKAGKKELRAGMSPNERVAYDFKQFRTQADTILRQHKVKMPAFYAERLNLWQERIHARASAGSGWENKVKADLSVIYKHGWIDAAQYKAATENVARVPKDKRGTVGRELNAEYFDRDHLLHDGAKEMGLKLPNSR